MDYHKLLDSLYSSRTKIRNQIKSRGPGIHIQYSYAPLEVTVGHRIPVQEAEIMSESDRSVRRHREAQASLLDMTSKSQADQSYIIPKDLLDLLDS